MFVIRKSDDRGHADHGWLKSWHTFSFADYYDPKHMAFRVLRVINEDFIDPDQGFGTHPHRDMEIVTYVIEGSLKHRDTLGNSSAITPGEIQRMSAGTGIQHSEFNGSKEQTTHLLQIWLLPNRQGLEPGYEQKNLSGMLAKTGLHKVVSGKQDPAIVSINQDVEIYVGKYENSADKIELRPGRYGWLQLIKGSMTIVEEGISLKAGDGLAVSDEKGFQFQAEGPTEFLFFDLP
jgi:quercetin 2,3-dioxygenase